MAKKEMKGECCSSDGCGVHRAMKGVFGLLTIIGGLLLIWPMGWFTEWHVLGVFLVLFGIKKLSHSLCGCC